MVERVWFTVGDIVKESAGKHFPFPQLLILAAIVVIVWLCSAAVRRRFGRITRQRRARRAQAAEQRAVSVLNRAGYRILGEQVRTEWTLEVESAPETYTLIADYLVTRWGRKWVAEVKTGKRALALQHGPTRRQLLEYCFAFGVGGVLLVDSEGGTIREVNFPSANGRSKRSTARWFIGLGLALLAGGAIRGPLSKSLSFAPSRADCFPVR